MAIKSGNLTEARITRDIIGRLKALRKAGVPVWWIKLHGGPMQKAGAPDLLVCLDGDTLWLEIKTATGAVTKLQKHVHAEMEAAGCWVEVVRSVGEAQTFFNSMGR